MKERERKDIKRKRKKNRERDESKRNWERVGEKLKHPICLHTSSLEYKRRGIHSSTQQDEKAVHACVCSQEAEASRGCVIFPTFLPSL